MPELASWVASGVLLLATDVLFIYVIWDQGSDTLQWGRAALVAPMIAGFAVAVVVGSAVRPR